MEPQTTSIQRNLSQIRTGIKPTLTMKGTAMKNTLTLLTALLLAPLAALHAAESPALVSGFDNPPQNVRPGVAYAFLGGIITEEGMREDLHAIKEAGLGNVDWLDQRDLISPVPDLPPPVEALGSKWYELIGKHGEFARENGLFLHPSMHLGNFMGVAKTDLENMAKEVLFSSVEIQGGGAVTVVLPQPETRPISWLPGVKEYYRDITVLAYPTPDVKRTAVLTTARPEVSVNAPYKANDLNRLCDGNVNSFWGSVVPLDTNNPVQITFKFAQPFQAAGISVIPAYHKGPKECLLEASDDGQQFRRVSDFTLGVEESKQIEFPPVTARWFRMTVKNAWTVNPIYDAARAWLKKDAVHIADVELLQPGEQPYARQDIRLLFLKMGRNKANNYPWSLIEGEWYASDQKARVDIQPGQVVEVTADMDANGRLTWNAPAGNWTVVRVGFGLLAGGIASAGPRAGTAMDLLSKETAEHYYNYFARPILDALGKNRSLVKAWQIDSFESDCANWTPGFREAFKKRRGYDLLPFLPVLQGRVVGSMEQSERFLWDYRRTLADLIAENHYAELARLCRQDGVPLMLQTPATVAPLDPLYLMSKVDIPMGETWTRSRPWAEPRGEAVGSGHQDFIKGASSAAHIYGKKKVAAEATTNGYEPWVSPFENRFAMDFAFISGMNMVNHYFYPHQAYAQPRKVGSFQRWGSHWNRNNTIWALCPPFFDYIARCSWMLQQGRPISDVLVFYGEDVPAAAWLREAMDTPVPKGYNYDYCNADVLINHAQAKNGMIHLDSGTQYRLLVMPRHPRLTPEIARAVERLVKGGATIVGPRPTMSPSLTGYPQCDREVERIAKELWDSGKVIPATDLPPVLDGLHLLPDFTYDSKLRNAFINFTHRQLKEGELYMVANARPEVCDFTAKFRVTGLVPEIWDADAATRVPVANYTDDGRQISFPMRLAQHQSLFVLFRNSDGKRVPVTQVEGSGFLPASVVTFTPPGGICLTAPQGNYELTLAGSTNKNVRVDCPADLDLNSGWTVNFPEGYGAPDQITLDRLMDFSKSGIEGVKYFSGTATYSKTLTLRPEQIGGDLRLLLKLGTVGDGAEVVVNGKTVRTLWAYPFDVDITPYVKTGENRLEIKVTNVWHNRLVGDSGLPSDQRITQPLSKFSAPIFRNNVPFSRSTPLRPSGLIGPVRIEFNRMVEINFESQLEKKPR